MTSLFDHQALAGSRRVPVARREQPTVEDPAQAPDPGAAVVAIITAPLLINEPAMVGFQRKEREIGALFATLSVPESRALHARLSVPQEGDHVAAAFKRLTIDRQHRLLAFLAAARRRVAVTAARSR